MPPIDPVIHPKTAAFLNQIRVLDRLPMTMIFYGPHPQSQLSVALELIEKMVERDHDHSMAQRVKERNHPDVMVVTTQGAEQYGMDEVKKMMEEAGLPPFECKRKWIVIADAEKLTPVHSNMLLKTIEEPLAGVHFILIVQQLDALLPTVLSRAIKIPFFPLSHEQLEKMQIDGWKVKLLQGSTHGLPLMDWLEGVGFFQTLLGVMQSYAAKDPYRAAIHLDDIDRQMGGLPDHFSEKDILGVTVDFCAALLLKLGHQRTELFFQELEEIKDLFDRHLKLKICIERLLGPICSGPTYS